MMNQSNNVALKDASKKLKDQSDQKVLSSTNDDEDLAKDAEDLTNLRSLEDRILFLQKIITVLALTGLGFVIGINESCTLRDDISCESGLNEFTDHDIALLFESRYHVPNVSVAPSGHTRLPPPYPARCTTPTVELLKAACAISTLATVLLMMWQLNTVSRHSAVEEALAKRHAQYKSTRPQASAQDPEASTRRGIWAIAGMLVTVLKRPGRHLQVGGVVHILLNCIHPFPGVSFLVPIESLGTAVSYRVESLLSLVMLVRLYHIAKLHKYQLLSTYLNTDDTIIVRNTQTIKMLNDPSISNFVLSAKIALARRPWIILIGLFLVLVFWSTYIIRVSEVPRRCGVERSHVAYIWNQMWMTLVAARGEASREELLPMTHMGRIAIIISMILGPIIFDQTAALFVTFLDFDVHEARLIAALDGDRLHAKVLVATTRLIQFWWRNLNKANTLEVILNGSSPSNSAARAGGSCSLFLQNMGLSTKLSPVQKPTHGRARRGSMLNLVSSLFDGENMPRILALQNRHEELRYDFYLALAEYGRFQEQQEHTAFDGSGTVSQRVTPGSLVERRLERVASGGAVEADEDAVPLQQAGLSNIAAAAAAALNPKGAYHTSGAVAGIPDEGSLLARRMSCARPSVARQSKMRGNGNGVGSTAFSFRLPSRARNSNNMHGRSAGQHTARFGVYPKILLEDDEDENDNESLFGGRSTEAGTFMSRNHPTRSGQNLHSGWAERTAVTMDRVEMRMAAVDGRLAKRSEQLLGLRRSLDLLSAALPPLENLDSPYRPPSSSKHQHGTENNVGLFNYPVGQDQTIAGSLQEMGGAAEQLFALFHAEGPGYLQGYTEEQPEPEATFIGSGSGPNKRAPSRVPYRRPVGWNHAGNKGDSGLAKQQSRSIALHNLSQMQVDSAGPVSTPSAWFNRPYSSNGSPASNALDRS